MALSAPQTDRQSYTQLLQLACQGNEHAIATLMNRHLKQQQITAHVTWEETCLHILLEAAQLLSPEPLASVIHKTVLKIQVEKLRSLKVSFRQSGEHQCVWSQQRTIAPPSPIPYPLSPIPIPDSQPDRAPLTPATSLSLADWLNQKAQALEPSHSVVTTHEETETRFLRFSFSLAETALLPLMSIRQLVTLQVQQILPVPAMPAAVVGIYNFRGEMLWLVDLGLQIGFQGVTGDRPTTQPSSLTTRQFSGSSRQRSGQLAIVIQAEGKSLGLLVPDVIDIESHNPKQLHPPTIDQFSPELMPFMQGYLVRSSSPVLDASALIHDRRFQLHAA